MPAVHPADVASTPLFLFLVQHDGQWIATSKNAMIAAVRREELMKGSPEILASDLQCPVLDLLAGQHAPRPASD